MRIGDWSSDVCSSDLVGGRDAHADRPVGGPGVARRLERLEREADAVLEAAAIGVRPAVRHGAQELVEEIAMCISEERRVGKGCVSTCRFRWSPCNEKKNTKTERNST